MLQRNYPELMRECEKALALVDREIERLQEWRRALEKEYTGLTGIVKQYPSIAHIHEQLALPGLGELPKGRRPQVAIFEDILREFGPMHVRDIVALAGMRGIPFRSNGKPFTEQVREKLAASKRFHLFGGNVWGLPEHIGRQLTRFELVAQSGDAQNGNGHHAPMVIDR